MAYFDDHFFDQAGKPLNPRAHCSGLSSTIENGGGFFFKSKDPIIAELKDRRPTILSTQDENVRRTIGILRDYSFQTGG